jgi:tRNA dimethylallyltransferase
MVYNGMDIGTAKPGPEVLAVAPHRLIDVLDPADTYSAARFRADALVEIEDITRCGRIPLLVGGTGLYFRALERGLSHLPAADPAVRRRLAEEAQARGWASLHARLAQVDPQAAARIHPHDPQRIQRALEVWELTGRPMTELMREHRDEDFAYRALKLILAPAGRDDLGRRVAERFRAMLEGGLVEEVAGLRRRGDLNPGLPSMRAVGYRQVWQYLDGRVDHETMVERAVVATRQLAKRQLTWLAAERGAQRLQGDGRGLVGGAHRRLRDWLAGAT